ncbi:hypothetical protein HK104_009107 [Borealophlyctis nickersoniae]|nr:hypothetical protein HK104_009107 [Borealophlyctis nickersoniae]
MAPIPATTKDAFSTLPIELSIQIIKYLNGSDVAKLATTSRHFSVVCKDKYLWLMLLERRFGKESIPEDENAYMETYKKFDHDCSFIPCSNMNIVWKEDQRYWSEEVDESSRSGTIMKLKNVCWFDVRTIVKGLPKGRYVPTWRLRFGSPSGLGGVEFGARLLSIDPDLPPTPLFTVPLTVACRDTLGRNTPWITARLPAITLPGPQDFHSVEVWMSNHDSQWKSGLFVDCLEFVDVGEGDRGVTDEEEEDEDGFVGAVATFVRGVGAALGF